MTVWVSGSLAYDIILDYPGKFADHIKTGKVHALSLSFLVKTVKKSIGGTAGNIAYNLSLLGLDSELLAAVGFDGNDILVNSRRQGVGVKGIKISKMSTAAGYIMTDQSDNQVAGFHPGAMMETVKLPKVESGDWGVIAAENPQNMARLARHYKKHEVKYIFDPGQAITALSKTQMRTCVKGATILIGNDYEINYVMDYVKPSCVVIRTYGPKGSEIIYPAASGDKSKKVKIGTAKVRLAVDPTGAGDAYRAGLLCGLLKGFDMKLACQLGATAAAFAVEKQGTQNHHFSYNTLVVRHNKNFKDKIK